TLLDAIQEVFAHHPLNLPPIVRADGVTRLKIGFGSPESVSKAGKQNGKTPKRQQKWQDRRPRFPLQFHLQSTSLFTEPPRNGANPERSCIAAKFKQSKLCATVKGMSGQ